MPGVIKNLIDWTSRFRPQPFDGKQGLLMSANVQAFLSLAEAAKHYPRIKDLAFLGEFSYVEIRSQLSSNL